MSNPEILCMVCAKRARLATASRSWVEVEDGVWVCRSCSVLVVQDAWYMRKQDRGWREYLLSITDAFRLSIGIKRCRHCGVFCKEAQAWEHNDGCPSHE
jgi:hypothetical protein